jgi:hypothetical protein
MKKAKNVKIGTCAGCGEVARINDSHYRVEFGNPGQGTLVRRAYHFACIGKAVIGYAYSYTENPGGEVKTACAPCGSYQYRNQDWSLEAWPLLVESALAMNGTTCTSCDADLYSQAYQASTAALTWLDAAREEAAR